MKLKYLLFTIITLELFSASQINATLITASSVSHKPVSPAEIDSKQMELEDGYELSSDTSVGAAKSKSYINMDTGVMRALSYSSAIWDFVVTGPSENGNGQNGYYVPRDITYSNAAVQFWEEIQIYAPSSMNSVDVTFSTRVHGHFSKNLPSPIGQLGLETSLGHADIWLEAIGSTHDRITRDYNWVTNSTSIYETLSITVNMQRDISGYFKSLTFYGGMSTSSSHGVNAHFANTAMLSMTLPEGVSYSSTSGTFLAHPEYNNGTPPNPVPEPATMLLFGTGFVGLAAIRRKKQG